MQPHQASGPDPIPGGMLHVPGPHRWTPLPASGVMRRALDFFYLPSGPPSAMGGLEAPRCTMAPQPNGLRAGRSTARKADHGSQLTDKDTERLEGLPEVTQHANGISGTVPQRYLNLVPGPEALKPPTVSTVQRKMSLMYCTSPSPLTSGDTFQDPKWMPATLCP